MPATPPRNRYAWYVVAVLMLASLSGNIDRMILAYLVGPIKRDLGISNTQMSLLMGFAFSLFYAVLGLPIGRLADRASRRNIMGVGVVLWSVFTSACAAVRTYGQLFLMRVGVGVGEATLNAPSVSMIADYFPRERLGRAMSVYSIGIFVGSGLAYMFGGAVAGMVGEQQQWTVPIIGVIRPWQSVFLLVGLPGLLVALLFLTVREPPRTGSMSRVGSPLPVSALVDYIRDNRRTFFSHSLGFASSAMVNFALAQWLATFLILTYHWQPRLAGFVQGGLTVSIGVVGVVVGGWMADRLARAGKIDAPLRVGMIGAAGMLVSATAYPLMPTATLAVLWLAIVNFFAAFPWGAASLGAGEMFPAPLRGQGVAAYFFVLSLVASTLGPYVVALFTDHVFGENGVRYSLVCVNVIGMTLALALFAFGRPAYRATLAYRDRWTPPPVAAR